jgi:hypothetical protein
VNLCREIELEKAANDGGCEVIEPQLDGTITLASSDVEARLSVSAVTGIAQPALLRASHIKPWAHCGNNAERLDVHNGFLLTADWDAAFDAGLVSSIRMAWRSSAWC